MTDRDSDDELAQLEPTDALERARRAERSTLPQLRTDIEWATTSNPGSAALWLALGIVYIRLGDLDSALTTLAQAQQRVEAKPDSEGTTNVELAIEISAARDWCSGPRTYKGPGVIRRAPNSRVFVELPDARYRWASFGLGELVDAGVVPWDGTSVKVQANLSERGWTVARFAPTDNPARGALAKDGKTLRFGELAYLTLRDPCPPEHLHWHLSSWRAAAQELPFAYRDRRVDILWDRLGVSSWAALAEHHATRVLAAGGKLTKAGKGLVVDGRVVELAPADQCTPQLRRARHARWKEIVESIPFTLVETQAHIDWPQLSTRHAIEPAVASWDELAAQFGPPPAPSEPRPPRPPRTPNVPDAVVDQPSDLVEPPVAAEPVPPPPPFVDTRPVRDVIAEILAALATKHAVTRYADLARAIARCPEDELAAITAELATQLEPISDRLTHGRGDGARDVSIGQFLARGVLYASKLPDFDAPAAIARLAAVLDARDAAPIAKLPLAIIAGTGSLAADMHRHLVGRGLEPRELWIRNRVDSEPTSLGLFVEIRYYRRDRTAGETALVVALPGLGSDDLPRLFDVIARLTERSITPVVITA